MKTTNYNFNLIEKSDRILNTLDDLNENFNNIDSELYEKEKELATTKQKLERAEQRLEKAEKKVDQAEAILDTSKSNGENVYFDNAKNYPMMSLKGEGKSEQITTTGTQLIDFENLVNVVGTHEFKDDILAITNTEQARAEVYYDVTQNYIKNAGKKIRFDFEKFESSIDISNYSIQLIIKFIDGTNTRYSPLLSDNWATKYNLTISSDVSNILSVQFYLSTKSALSANTLKITKPHLHTGESTIEYEPYTGNQPAPNPNYPQEIKTISEASYKGVGKNYFDIGSNEDYFATKTNGSVISESNLHFVDFSIENNKILINSYTTTGYLWFSKLIKIEKNTNYTISSVKSGSFRIVGINSLEINSVGVNLCEVAKTEDSKTFNSGDYEYYFVSFYPGGTNIYFENIQIEKGDTSTDYEPYQESTVAINLQGNELASVGTVSDKLLIDRKGNVAIEKNVGKRIFTGAEEENWVFNSATLNNFEMVLKSVPLYKNDSVSRIISNTFLGVMWNNSWTKNNSITIGGGNNIFVRTDKYNTIEDFKAFLSEQNLIIYYVLKNPQLISLGTISNPEIFKGVNNIDVETNLGNMNIEVEYVEDTRKVFEERLTNLEQAIVAQGGI